MHGDVNHSAGRDAVAAKVIISTSLDMPAAVPSWCREVREIFVNAMYQGCEQIEVLPIAIARDTPLLAVADPGRGQRPRAAR